MILWLDAHLPPQLVSWLRARFELQAAPVRDLGLLQSEDAAIFAAAREAGAVVMTKDIDFVHLVERLGPPPQVIWVTCGNTSNRELQRILSETLAEALRLLDEGEPFIEISEGR